MLRKKGKSYSEILAEIPVAKSTLSLWLRDVGLAKAQQQILSRKKLEAGRRGADARRRAKEDAIRTIRAQSCAEIGALSVREKWLLGIALYWGEGTKEKTYRPGVGLVFNNSDPAMTKFYIQWLTRILHVPKGEIHLSLYVHITRQADIDVISKFWAKYLDFPTTAITGVYWKKSKIRTVRKNIDDLYYGTMRVKVPMSSTLNRRVTGWIEGIVEAK